MDNPILTTKVNSPPVREHLVQRSALLTRLDEGLSAGHSLILISAPAGCGKTTLAAEWLAHLVSQGFSSAWLTLEKEENNPVLFCNYLVAALRRVLPDIGRELLTLTELPQLPPVETLLTGLINELSAKDINLVLVLDDFQAITADFIHQAVRYLYTHAPYGLHIAIISRQDPPFTLARLRATGKLLEIRKDDLNFSPNESRNFFHRSMGLTLTDDQILNLVNRTEGWVTGLQIAALSLRGREKIDEFIGTFNGSHHFLFDYLAEEVLHSETPDIVEFLLQTPVLNRLCGPLCDALTSHQDGHAVLQHLQLNNLFLDPLDDQRQWYRYHPLFADFLRENLSDEQKADLALKASAWCETHTTLPEAISYAIQAGHAQTVTRLIRLAGPDALRSGSVVALNGWLDSLPKIELKKTPDLLILKGITLMLRNQIDDASHFAELAGRMDSSLLTKQDRGRLLGLKAYLAHARYDEAQAERLGVESVSLLDEDSPSFKGMVLSMLGQVQRQLGNPRLGEETIREALRCDGSVDPSIGSMAAAANLVAVLDVLGRRREAESYCLETLEKMTVKGSPHPLSFIISIPCGMVLYEANQLERARKLISQGFADCRRLGFNPIIIGGLPTMALIRSAEGDTAGAIEDSRTIVQEAAHYQVTWVARMGRVLEVNLALRQGDPDPMEAWLSLADLNPHEPDPLREDEYISMARYLVVIEKHRQAVCLLLRLLESARNQGRGRSLITINILLAIARYQMGEQAACWEALNESLSLSRPQDYIRRFLDEGPLALNLLQEYRLQQNIRNFDLVNAAFCKQLINAFNLNNTSSSAKSENNGLIYSESNNVIEGLTPSEAYAFRETLTKREIEVLALIAEGLSIQEISRKLYLTPNTLKAHTGSIYGKLDVHSRVAAVNKAREQGLIK